MCSFESGTESRKESIASFLNYIKDIKRIFLGSYNAGVGVEVEVNSYNWYKRGNSSNSTFLYKW